jgi:3',5'-cyclic-AMP phosphodiesterase
MKRHESVETIYMRERTRVLRGLAQLDRRGFLRAAAAAAGAAMAQGLVTPHSFLPIRLVHAAETGPIRIAYISDSHLYKKELNDRFVRAILRAVDDVNRLDPQPDFVLYGGDLAQLGQPEELELGAQILKEIKAPVKIIVGEHDWYLDMGERWRELFGDPTYSFDHRGVHFVALNSVIEEDFWTARKMTPMERMRTVAGLDNAIQNRFTVGQDQLAWLAADLAGYDRSTPIVVFSHSPLYKLYRDWNFWTDDAEQVQALLQPFRKVTVIHGHTHQLVTNRIGNIFFHGMLATAWPWPYAPEGLPELTVQMERPDPFDPHDGCGNGQAVIHPDGLADKIYYLWNRNPVTVSREYMISRGARDRPPATSRPSY